MLTVKGTDWLGRQNNVRILIGTSRIKLLDVQCALFTKFIDEFRPSKKSVINAIILLFILCGTTQNIHVNLSCVSILNFISSGSGVNKNNVECTAIRIKNLKVIIFIKQLFLSFQKRSTKNEDFVKADKALLIERTLKWRSIWKSPDDIGRLQFTEKFTVVKRE